MVDMDHRFKKNGQIIYKEFSTGPVLIDPYRRSLMALNEASSEIWKLLDSTRTLRDIIVILQDMYDVTPRELEQDVARLMKELIKREAVL